MKYEKIPIGNIELDLENPRIKQFLEIYSGPITAESIALALNNPSGNSSSSSFETLKESIKVNKGLINPITVNRFEDGRMVVVEGNTRLQIYKDFAKSDPEGPWNEIPAVIYENLPMDEIHAIRLQTHLVGPRDWDAFSKAKYLHQLSEIDKMPIEKIISFCGGQKSEIIKYINTYNDMMEYYFPKAEEMDVDTDPRDYSKFEQMQRSTIQQAIVVNGYNKFDFAEWVINKNVDTAQNVRDLPEVLNDERARKVFLRSNISEAVKVLNANKKQETDLSGASIYELAAELTQKIKDIEYKEFKALKNDYNYEEKRDVLMKLKEQLDDLLADIEGE